MNDAREAGRAAGLAGENLRRADIDQPWEQDNQAWWDWYITLAEREESAALPSRTGEAARFPVFSVDPPVAASAAATASDRAGEAQPADDARVYAELATEAQVSAVQVDWFRRNGYIKLRNVLSAGVVARLRREMVDLLEAAYRCRLDGGLCDRFLSLEMVWRKNDLIRAFVTSPRIAGIGAQLLGVPAVRLYHDNLMSKEPGGGRTPWHFDDHHFPLDTHDVVTAWIPAQAIHRDMGPLAFATPIDAWELVKDVPFSKYDTSYDRRVAEIFRDAGIAVDDGAFAAGEVSFHHNLSFHTAGANRSTTSRVVLANTYYADGARTVANPTMVSGDWQQFMPGTGPGEVAATPMNPICWPAGRSPTAGAHRSDTAQRSSQLTEGEP